MKMDLGSMSAVWVTIPSARPAAEVETWAKAWKALGYKIALWRDRETADDERLTPYLDHVHVETTAYPGYAVAVNGLVKRVMELDQQAEWFIIGGDDVFPDPSKTAKEIAFECEQHFDNVAGPYRHPTFGVCQPIGDDWGTNPNHPREDMRGSYISRVAGSAWLGREFCRRVNGGRGPLWSGNPNAEREIDRKPYTHMWVDSELRDVAVKLGVYWERPDLTHHHAHAGRVPHYTVDMIPEHLKKWTIGEEGRRHWKEFEALYFSRRDAGFPGSEPL